MISRERRLAEGTRATWFLPGGSQRWSNVPSATPLHSARLHSVQRHLHLLAPARHTTRERAFGVPQRFVLCTFCVLRRHYVKATSVVGGLTRRLPWLHYCYMVLTHETLRLERLQIGCRAKSASGILTVSLVPCNRLLALRSLCDASQ